jgi:hypothetical protein
MRSIPIATACTIYHKFFCEINLDAYDPYLVAMSSIYLAGKVEEQHLRTRDIINVSNRYTDILAEVCRRVSRCPPWWGGQKRYPWALPSRHQQSNLEGSSCMTLTQALKLQLQRQEGAWSQVPMRLCGREAWPYYMKP